MTIVESICGITCVLHSKTPKTSVSQADFGRRHPYNAVFPESAMASILPPLLSRVTDQTVQTVVSLNVIVK